MLLRVDGRLPCAASGVRPSITVSTAVSSVPATCCQAVMSEGCDEQQPALADPQSLPAGTEGPSDREASAATQDDPPVNGDAASHAAVVEAAGGGTSSAGAALLACDQDQQELVASCASTPVAAAAAAIPIAVNGVPAVHAVSSVPCSSSSSDISRTPRLPEPSGTPLTSARGPNPNVFAMLEEAADATAANPQRAGAEPLSQTPRALGEQLTPREGKLPSQVESPKVPKNEGLLTDGAPSLQEHHAVYGWSQPDLPPLRSEADQRLRVFCGVWNLHGKQAPADLSSWLVTRPLHHVYVIGTCECERSIGMSMLWASKARWEKQVKDHLGEDFMMVASNNMSAIHVMVFVHRHLWRYSWDIRTGQVATGFADLIGNKGGTQVGLSIGRTSVLFVHAHLAAHQGKMKERTQNLSRILVDSPIRRDKAAAGIHEEFDRVFFMGDLNPRLEASRSDVDSWLAGGILHKCLEKDQLLPLLQQDPTAASVDGPAGMWPLFQEAAIEFPPTYKYDTNTDRYDSSKKQRVPSWTDRILWKRDEHIRPLTYTAVQSMQSSDHRPIFAQFEVSVDLDSWEEPPSQAKGRSSVCCVQ